MTEHTRAKWAERIRQWRDSGLSAEEFTAGKDYGASALRGAVSQLGGKATQPRPSRASRKAPLRAAGSVVPCPPPPRAPRMLPVRVWGGERVGAEMIVEVGGARIRVARGVDVALLGEVVLALQGGGR